MWLCNCLFIIPTDTFSDIGYTHRLTVLQLYHAVTDGEKGQASMYRAADGQVAVEN